MIICLLGGYAQGVEDLADRMAQSLGENIEIRPFPLDFENYPDQASVDADHPAADHPTTDTEAALATWKKTMEKRCHQAIRDLLASSPSTEQIVLLRSCGEGLIPPNPYLRFLVDLAGWYNQVLCELADRVYWVQAGQSFLVKKTPALYFDIHFMRHGTSEANLEGRYAGVWDTPLCDEAREKAKALGAEMKEDLASFSYFFASPKSRAQETASLVSGRTLYDGLDLIPGFSERNFGPFEHHNFEELKDSQAYRTFVETAGVEAPEGAENQGQLRKRLTGAFQDLGQRLAWPERYGAGSLSVQDHSLGAGPAQPKKVLLVCHAGVMMEMVTMLVENPLVGRDPKAYPGYYFALTHGLDMGAQEGGISSDELAESPVQFYNYLPANLEILKLSFKLVLPSGSLL